MIQPYNKGKDISVMIWACFGGDCRKSDLVYMPGDPDSKKKKVDRIQAVLRAEGWYIK